MKQVRKVFLSTLSILGLSFVVWVLLMLNPSVVYGNSTTIGNVTVYHNAELQEGVEAIVKAALELNRTSEIFDEQMKISLCMNDNSVYPYLSPVAGGTAYAYLDKAVFYESTPDFQQDFTEFAWEINNYEVRRYNLTYLLAHEFMHNYQYNHNPRYQILSTLGKPNWKLEGHADYITREFKNDGQLCSKIEHMQELQEREYQGVPVFELEDGTIQNLAYYKYALVIQYLMEVEKLSFSEVCKLDKDLQQHYFAMLSWSLSE